MILVFGSVNLDLVFGVDRMPQPGETLLAQGAARIEPGGKGANQAAAAARDGAEVALAGAVGRDAFAELALAGLEGVDTARVLRVDAPTGLAAITVDSEGRNQIVVASGANRHARADAAGALPDTLLLQMEVPPEQNAALIRRARAQGCRVVLNLAPAAALPRNALGMVDWLLVNETEADWLADHLGCAPDVAALRSSLGVDVVRTLGAGGAEAATAEGVLRATPPPVTVVDTTGAGDCFAGVFAAALDRGADPAAALRRATVAGALACTKKGAQAAQPDRAAIDAALGAADQSAS